jgi:hypothetical protein
MSKFVSTVALAVVLVAAAGCSAAGPSSTIQLRTLNNSGVTGHVMLTDLGGGRTRVEVTVDPAGHLDMPAHIHPGTCDTLVPQPRYPLRNVVNGVSTTEVPASLSELLTGELAVNLHNSNDDLRTYTACAELPSESGLPTSPPGSGQPIPTMDPSMHMPDSTRAPAYDEPY